MISTVTHVQIAQHIHKQRIRCSEVSQAVRRYPDTRISSHGDDLCAISRVPLHAVVSGVQNENSRCGDEDISRLLQLELTRTQPTADDLYGCCRIGTKDNDAMVVEVGDVESVLTGDVNTVIGVEKR